MFNVLLVDDEEMAIVVLRCALPWYQYGFTNIYTTTSSSEAYRILSQEHIDACFLDIEMPGMSGLDLLASLQQANLDTQFVIVSGYSDFSYAKQAIGFGVCDYCLKPVVAKDCTPVLEKLYNRILANHLSKDPVYISALMTEENSCKEFLSNLTEGNTTDRDCAVLLISREALLPVFTSADNDLSGHFLFMSDSKVLLFLKDASETDKVVSLFQKLLPSVLLIYSSCPATVSSLQNTLKRIITISNSKNTKASGIIKLSDINEKMTDLFSSVLKYMDTNYAKALSLQELAHEFGINYSYLSQIFKKILNRSFSEHLTSIRMENACRMLSETQMPITDISVAVGILDYHYFCNLFKKYYSMTPSQYRNVPNKETRL